MIRDTTAFTLFFNRHYSIIIKNWLKKIMNSLFPTILYSSIVASSYVVCLHYHGLKGNRNDPKIIKFRIKRIILITVINLILAPFILVKVLKTAPDVISCFQILGLKNIFIKKNVFDMLKTLYLFMILFCGPLLELILEKDFINEYMSWIEACRDLFVAPLTEEFFYTSLTTGSILAFELSKLDTDSIYSPTVFYGNESIDTYLKLSPLFFGFAHLHHSLEMLKQGRSYIQVVVTCGFQCLYTTLFGYLTNRVFVNTGSVWCCFIAHAFCNFMGLPNLNPKGCILYKLTYWGLLIFGAFNFNLNFDKLTHTG